MTLPDTSAQAVEASVSAPPARAPARASGRLARGWHGLRSLPPVVWLLGTASLLNDVSSEAIFPLLPMFLASLGAPMSYLGLIEGGATAVASAIRVGAGHLSDGGPRRLLVIGGYALPAIARAVIAVAFAPWHVLAARVADRGGKGIRLGPRDALIADAVPPQQRGRAFGLNRSMDHLGAAIGCLLAYSLLKVGVGLSTTFAVAAALGLIAPILLFFRLRDLGPHPADRSGSVEVGVARSDLRRGFRPYLSVCVLFALGNSSDAFLLVRARELGWSITALPLLWLFHHLVKSVAALPGGALSDRHSRAVVVAAGWTAYALTYLGFAFATAWWHVLVLFVAYALYHGLAEGAERAIIADLSGRGARGRAYGLYHGLVGAAALPAGFLTGAVWDRWGARWALGANAACAALAGIFLAWLAFGGALRRDDRKA